MMALEPRIMFDAAAVATAEAAQAPHPDAAPTPVTQARDVVFIDSRVKDPDTLLQDIRPGTEIVRLDANSNGLQQIADYLSQHPGAGSAQIITEGNAGDLWLGNTYLDVENIADHATTLAQLGGGLQTGGDILIYSCNTAADARGLEFVSSLARLTGCDVAASSDRTGASGDWELEITTGSIEATPVLSPSGYAYDLATITVTSSANSGTGTLRNAIAAATAGDTITFSTGMSVGLTSGQLVISKNLTIDGDLDNNGTADVTLDANYISRVLSITAGTVTLDGLIIREGRVSGNGGGLGSLAGDGLGGGISIAGGTVTIINSTITNNVASGGGGGGSGDDYSYGGGGGGGFNSIGGGTGGAYNGNYPGGLGGGGFGGIGGYASYSDQAGKGGSTIGGAGGLATDGFVAGGAGGTAGTIGGGGGGAGGSLGADGGDGGDAAGGLFIGSGATVFMSSTTISNNLGAGGGGGGGYINAGGNGGDGIGGILNAGTLNYQSSTVTFTGNIGSGGLGGDSNGTPGTNGGSFTNLTGGTINSNYTPTVTVTSVNSSTANGTYKVGDTVSIQVNFSAAVTVTGTPQLTLETGTTDRVVDYASGSGTSALTFTYTVQAGDTSADLDYQSTAALTLNGGTIKNGGTDATLTLASPGAANSLGNNKAIVIDGVVPTVSSVSATTANGTYKVGDTIAITVTFAEAVTVTGTPTLTLSSGGTASYASGSGTNTLTFNYTIGAGDSAADLDYSATNSLALSGGTIRDAAGNDGTLTLPTVGGGSSLGGQKNIVVDGIAPTLQSDTVPANTTYATGQNLDFTVTYSEAVTVNTGGGTPYIGLTLNTGGAVEAAYVSGSGTTTLTFRYTIASTNVDADGVTTATSITLNGGTIRDAAGNNAATTGITFASTAGVLVEAVAPTVSSINRVSSATTNATSVDYTVTFSESVSGVDSSDFSLTTTGTATGSIASVAQVNGSTYTVTVNTISGDGTIRLDLKNAGTGISDTPGNAITTGFTSGQTYTIDNTAPAVTSVGVPANATYIAGQNLDFTVNFGEAVTVNTGSGTPRIAITLDTGGTVYASYLSGSGTSALVFRYTVASGNADSNGIAVAGSLDTNGGTIRDAAGNNATATLNSVGSTASVLVDAIAPTVNSVSVPSNGTYITGQNLDLTVNFSENVTANTGGGTPRIALTLDTGGTVYASYISGSGTSALVFRYTVASGNLDADGITVGGSIDVNGGTLRDSIGNDATLTLNSVGSTASVLVDAVAPSVSSINRVTSSPTNATSVDYTVTFSESVSGVDAADFTLTATGTAAGTIASVNQVNASTYTVTVSSISGDGTLRLDLNNAGSGISDTPGNAIGGGFTSGQTYTIDNTAPAVTSVGVPGNATYIVGQNLDFTVNFDSAVTVNTGGGTPRIALTLDTGGTVYASYLSGSGTSALVFRYTVASGIADPNGITVGALSANGGTLRDSAGNNATLTLNSVGSTASVLVDGVAPTVSTIDRVGTSPTNAISVDYTVTFLENVSGVDTADFTLTATGTAAGTIASVAQVNGSTYTVTVNTISGDGTLRLDLNNAGTGIADTPGNTIGGGFTSGQAYTIDNTAPAVISVGVPANATYIASQNLDFTVNFSENVTVNTGGGTPYIDLTLDTGGTVQAAYVSGSGTGALVFRYTVASGNVDSNGIALGGSITLNGGTLRDAVGNNATLTLNSVGSTASVLIDGVAPTVSTINRVGTSPTNATSVDYTVAFSENVSGVDTADFTLTTTGTAAGTIASVAQVNGSTYTVTVNTINGDGTLRLDLNNAGTGIADTPGNAIGGGFTGGQAYTIDNAAPTVTSVGVPANATYIAGQNLDFTVNFDSAVSVDTSSGTPRIALTLDTGGTVYASYLSGSGTNALVFRYTVANGNADPNGITVGTLSANGGTLRDSAGNDSTLTLNSVGSTASVLVDALAPTVGSVSVPASGTYAADQNLDFTVNFSENVTVNTAGEAPYIALTLDTGGAVQATYVSGSGTNALVFRYTVANGNVDSTGVALGGSITLNGATLRDAIGNDADTTLNGSGSTASVLVDGVAPSVSSINRASTSPTNATSVDYTVTFSENVSGIDTSDFTLTATGTAAGTIASVSAVNGSTYTVTVNGITGDGTLRLDLKNTGTGIADVPGNAIGGGFTSGQVYTFDHTAPAVASVGVPANATYITGQNLDFTVNFDSVVTVDASGGTPRIVVTLDTGGVVYANYVSGSGTSALTFRYAVAAGNLDANGIALANSIDANGSLIRDAIGNDATLTLSGVGSTGGVLVDGVAPNVVTINRAGTSPTNATSVDYTVTFSENVSGVDVSDFTLTATGTAAGTIASVNAVDGSTYIVTVNSITGDGTLRLDSNSSATGIADTPGNTIGGGFTSGQTYVFDHAAPTVNSVNVPANGAYIEGQNLDFTVNFNENITVDTGGGTPHIAVTLDTGGAARADYLSGSGTTALTFRYTVVVGNLDTSGIALANTITANGGTLNDAVGNGAVLALNNVASTSAVTVDAIAPSVASAAGPGSGLNGIGRTLDFTLSFSETVLVDTTAGTPSIALTLDNGQQVQASYLGGSGTSSLTFRHAVAAGEVDVDGLTVATAVTLNSGTIRDATGHDAAVSSLSFNNAASIRIDGITPQVTSIVRAGAVPGNATSLDYVLTFSENVTGLDSSDLSLQATGTATGNIASVTALNAQTYRITVNNVAGDGTLRLDLRNSGTGIADAASNPIAAGFSTGESYSLDHSAPQITSVGVPAADTYVEDDHLDFIVSFSEAVIVDTANGTPRIAMDFDSGGAHYATYLAGSGSNALTFRYSVAQADQDVTGIALSSAIDLNGGRILDSAGNSSVITLVNVGATNAIKIGGVPPTLAPPPKPTAPTPPPVVETGPLSSAAPAVLTAFSDGPASAPDLITTQVSATVAPLTTSEVGESNAPGMTGGFTGTAQLDGASGSLSYSSLSAPDSTSLHAPTSRYIGIGNASAGEALLHAGIPEAQLAISAQRPFSFALPSGTFVSGPGTSVTVEAHLSNGQPLPSWLRFDPASGTFEGTPPRGWRQPLTIVLTARDQNGNEAVVRVRVQVEREQAPIRTTPTADAREHVPWNAHARHSGKASLAEQFAQHGHSAWQRSIDELMRRAPAANEEHSTVDESA